MKTLVLLIALLALIALGFFGYRFVQTNMGEEALEALHFPMHTMQEGLDAASKNGKLILADYSAIWCPTCRRLDQEVFADKRVADAINENFVYVRLEYDSDAGVEFAEKHNIQGFPRIIVLDTDGAKIVEMPLIFSPEEYAKNLMNVVSTRKRQ